MSDIAFSVLVGNGFDDIIFKTIMLKGDKGNSIASIEKTSTSGKVDTYTIYLTDGTVGGTFTVTNGEDGAPVNIDDTVTALDKTWSSSKLSGMIKSIDDNDVDADKLWSSQKISSLIPQTAQIVNQPMASFSDGADNVPVSSLIVDIEAYQAGTGDASPTNIRAISGFDKCHITKCAVNIWDEQWEAGAYNATTGEKQGDSTRIRSKNMISVKPSMSFYIVAPLALRIFQYKKNGDYIGYATGSTGGIFTTDANCSFIAFQLGSSSNPYQTYNNDISLNYPATDTSYHAFNGGIDTIDLTQEVYGGTLDVTTGLLTITHKKITYDGSQNWSVYSSGNGYYKDISNMESGTSLEGLSNLFPYFTNSSTLGFRLGVNNNRLYIYQANTIEGVSDVTTWRAFLSENNLEIVYPLATPITVQLTPTQVRTLLGLNNIIADTGDINELVYFKTGAEAVARLIEAYIRN